MREQLRRIRNTAKAIPWLAAARLNKRPPGVLPKDLNGQRVLIVQWNAIGDALMTTPLLGGIKRRFPEALIDVLTTPVNKPIFECQTTVESVLVLPVSAYGAWSAARRQRLAQYDLIIDATADFRSACTTRMLSAYAKVATDKRPVSTRGFSRTVQAGAITLDLSHFYDDSHPYSEQHHIPSLLYSLGRPWLDSETPARLTFSIPPEARHEAMDWFGGHGVDPARSVILHPGAKWLPKRWPESRWVLLVKALPRAPDPRTPILVGSEGDLPMLRRIATAGGPGVKKIAGCDISTLAAIVDASSVAVCNDSFIMHLARALDKPVVALFGPVDPGRVMTDDANTEILYQAPFCSPCQLYFQAQRCWRGMNFCMHQIEVSDVLAAVERCRPSE